MTNFRFVLTTECLIVYYLNLMCVIFTAESYGLQCNNKNICASGFLCCESPVGEQWCCPSGQRCCSKGQGCCIASYRMATLYAPSNDNYSFKNIKSMPDASNSIAVLNKKNLGKHGAYRSYRRCDKTGISFCGKDETCCRVAKTWKCCPNTNVSCCEVENHCCPSKPICDSAKRSGCEGDVKTSEPTESILRKSIITDNANKYRLCPDGKKICLSTNTCCLITNETYGCCAYENAVCCSDLINCCPPKTVCNIETTRCDPLTKRSQNGFHIF